MKKFDLSMLNECQRKAVEDTEGAVLVFAGAGSGKTRVLTYRVANLIENGVDSYRILAITFTNKATREMKERLQDMLGDNSVWISTFHSFCAFVLRKNGDCLGYNSNYSIYDETGVKRVIKIVLKEKNLEESNLKDSIRYHISKAKNLCKDSNAYFEYIKKRTRDAIDICECYQRYEEIMKQNNAMDYDDLLMKTAELFENHPEVLEYYQNRFHYIHVDEFQDTNEVQMKITKLLAKKHNNIFVVGDDDQSIYGFRGANIRNILDFEQAFPNAKIYKLMENYRSTQYILQAANNVICNNTGRKEKELFTNGSKGVRVEYKFGFNDHNEAEWVIDNIKTLINLYGYKRSDFAILVRANSLTRVFEGKLREKGISYKVYGGFKFFERKEIQDVLSYLRVLINPFDDEAITRIINVPRRGIGASTIENLQNYSHNNGINMYDAIMKIEKIEDFSPSVKRKIIVFAELLQDLQTQAKEMDLFDFGKYLIEKVGFEESFKATGKEDDLNRWENLVELLAYIKEYEKANPKTPIEQFLQNIVLVSDEDNTEEDNVVLATMHSVKGLEFRVVFIVGLEEGTFPSNMSMNEENGIEEERRVMYVAITRAKERLYLSCAQRRFKYNREQSYIPSRFIYESMGEDRAKEFEIKKPVPDIKEEYNNINQYTAYSQSKIKKYNKVIAAPKIEYVKEKVFNTNTDGFVSGAKVTHRRYGTGTIIAIDGSGASKNATIAFKDLGIKKFTLSSAPLKLL